MRRLNWWARPSRPANQMRFIRAHRRQSQGAACCARVGRNAKGLRLPGNPAVISFQRHDRRLCFPACRTDWCSDEQQAICRITINETSTRQGRMRRREPSADSVKDLLCGATIRRWQRLAEQSARQKRSGGAGSRASAARASAQLSRRRRAQRHARALHRLGRVVGALALRRRRDRGGAEARASADCAVEVRVLPAGADDAGGSAGVST